MRNGDELSHQIKQAAQQQAGDYGPFVYGHVASYDPTTHRIRAVLPAMRDEGGNPILTAWMPLGTAMSGVGIGIQFAPMGGATLDNPTKGELVKIARFDRTLGVGFVDGFMFNTVATPPVTDLKPGELAIVANGGSLMRFHEDKSVELNGQDKLNITMVGDVNITTQGAATITAQGNATVNAQGNLSLIAAGSLLIEAVSSAIKASGGTALKLVTEALAPLFNSHTHPLPGGGSTSPPTQQMGAAELTTVLEAQ